MLVCAACTFDSAGSGTPAPATLGSASADEDSGEDGDVADESGTTAGGAATTADPGDGTETTVGPAEAGETADADGTSGPPPPVTDTSTGGVVDPLVEYADCVGGTCEMPGNICSQVEGYQWCGQTCDSAQQCPLPESGNAPPICTFGLGEGRCALDCFDYSTTCPDGMTCEAIGTGQGTVYRCMW